MDIRISFAIAHCPWDAERRSNVEQMLERLAPGTAIVTCDDPPPDNKGPWPTYRRAFLNAIEAGREVGATHVCTFSDDMLPSVGFHEAVHQAVARRPRGVVELFSMRHGPEWCRQSGFAWVRGKDGLWGGTIVFPIDWMERLIDWADRRILPNCILWDDYLYQYYLRKIEQIELWVTAPSLLQHMSPSSTMIAGHNQKNRVATWYAEEAPPPEHWDRGWFDEGGGDGSNSWCWIENFLRDPRPWPPSFKDPTAIAPQIRESPDGTYATWLRSTPDQIIKP